MPGPLTLLLFAVAAITLLVIPGPAVLFIVTRSVAQGRTAGLVSVLGVHAGSVVHIAAAALGVSALLAASATAFAVVKYLGAAYLIYLGLRRLFQRHDEGGAPTTPPVPAPRLFGQGFVVNVLNPKTAVFFLAFLPQFVNPARGPVAFQILVLGLCFIALGLCSDCAYALLASALASRLRRSTSSRRRLNRASGLVFIGLGASAAFAGHRTR